MSQPPIEVLCAGLLVADFVCAPVPALPESGGLALTDELTLTIGGCAANVAADLARLGHCAHVRGQVGDDVLGRFILDSLAAAGAEVSAVTRAPGVGTGGTQVINVVGADRRFIHALGANACYDASEITDEDLRASRVLYIGGFLLMPRLSSSLVRDLFRRARRQGARTVLDVVLPPDGDVWPRLAPVLPETDVFLPNHDEARRLTGEREPSVQAQRLHQAGARTVIVTSGSTGSVLVTDHERLRAGVFPVEALDSTGTGDAFAAGLISGMLRDAPWDECLLQGSAVGASCVRQAGATAGVFNRQQLDAFLSRERLMIERW